METDKDQIKDQILVCQDCGSEFVFSAPELKFYKTKGLYYPPKRCPKCRKIRRLTIDSSQMPEGRHG